MHYFDTSFLAPLILPEATSEAISAFVAGLPVETLAISQWTRVEFASLLGREARMGAMKAADMARAEARFEAMVALSFIVLLPSAADYELARRYLRRFETGLRAGDALHLAIAANQGVETIYSLDKTMVKAARGVGLPVNTGIRVP